MPTLGVGRSQEVMLIVEEMIKNKEIGARLQVLSQRIDREPLEKLQIWAEKNVLAPLGLHVPVKEEDIT